MQRANAQTGGTSQYFPNRAGRTEDLMEFAQFAKDAGAGGYLVMPRLLGFDLINRLASHPDLCLPIMTHPALLGPCVLATNYRPGKSAVPGGISTSIVRNV